MLNGSSGSCGLARPSAMRSSKLICKRSVAYHFRYRFISAGENLSKPAATGVWVVNKLPTRVAASATSNGWPLSSIKDRARSSTANAAWPSLRWQTSGFSPSCFNRRHPAIPSISSCCKRNSGPPPYSSLVMPRIHRDVAGVVAVEQIKLEAADLCLPHSKPQVVVGKVKGDAQKVAVGVTPRRYRQPRRRIVWKQIALIPFMIDCLSKITLLIEQSHAHDWHAQIATRFELIARHIAQASRVDRQRLAQAELHAEIRDAPQRRT